MILETWTLFPAGLGFLALLPLVYLFLHSSERTRELRLGSWIGPRVQTLAGKNSPRRRGLRHALSLSGFSAAIFAVVQPAWGVDPEKVQVRGVDLFLCLDVSRSMLAQDLAPDRLRRAHIEIDALSKRARGDRLGLVAFAGDARLVVPLTRDMDTFSELVHSSGPLSANRGGTNVGAALETALKALPSSSLEGGDAKRQLGNHEVIVLISDGEDLEGRGLSAARLCKDRNVMVHCVGVGSSLGSKIAIEEEEGSGFLRDRSGQEVVTQLDEEGLSAVAEMTGGQYLSLGENPRALVSLYEAHVLGMEGKQGNGDPNARRNHYQWPLFLAFVFFAIELAMSERRVSA